MRARTGPWGVVTLVVALSCQRPGIASAQDQEEATGAAVARAAHRRGTAAYQLGNWDEAIAAFRQAYALAPTPGLLFNLAQAYRAKGPEGCADALRTYRAYLREDPQAPNRSLTLGHVADMERCVEENQNKAKETAPPASQPQPPPVPAQPSESPGPTSPAPSAPLVSAAPPLASAAPADAPFPWPHLVLGGVGVTAAVVGAVMLGSAASEFSRLDAQCPDRNCAPGSWQSYQTQEQVGLGLVIGGAALAVGAAVVWLVVPGSRPRSTPASPGSTAVLRF